MSIVGRQARKSSASDAARKRDTSRPKSSYRRKKSNGFIRFLARYPKWVLWLFGLLLGGAYIWFLLAVVFHFAMPWRARYGDVPEPEGFRVRGVDISHYQESIDWRALSQGDLAGHPPRFVIMKATEGTQTFDETFNDNFHKAHQYGFIRGAYHFYVPRTDAAQQAQFFLEQAHLMPGDLPPVLDIEKKGKLTTEELRSAVREWLRIVGNYYGVKPIIYTNYAFKRDYLDTPEFNQYPFWIAHYYKDKLEYQGKWVFWQYTDCGRVDGIKGDVDCNVFNGSLQDLYDFCITEEQYPIRAK